MVTQTTTHVPAVTTIELIKKTSHAPNASSVLSKKLFKPSTQIPWYISHEVPRKVWHSSIGFFVLGYHFWYGATLGHCLAWLAPLALSFIALDVSRLSRDGLNTWFCRVFGSMLRQHEHKSLTSSSFFYGGVLLALLLNPNNASAILCILYLSWSDTVAGVFGKYYSHLVLNGMTWWESGSRSCNNFALETDVVGDKRRLHLPPQSPPRVQNLWQVASSVLSSPLS